MKRTAIVVLCIFIFCKNGNCIEENDLWSHRAKRAGFFIFQTALTAGSIFPCMHSIWSTKILAREFLKTFETCNDDLTTCGNLVPAAVTLVITATASVVTLGFHLYMQTVKIENFL